MLFNPAYDFPHVAEKIVMPKEQRPSKAVTPATFAAAKQVAARLPDRYEGYSVREFLQWEAAHRNQAMDEAFVKNQTRYSKALDC